MEKQEYERAIQEVREKKKQEFIDSFQNKKREKTDFCTEKREDGVYDFFYGVPVLEGGHLKGFTMMTFTKVYGGEEVGFGGFHTAPDKEYKNKNGTSFMSVDEYLEFYKKHLTDDTVQKILLEEQKEAENLVLNKNKFAKVRNKLAKKIDNVLGTHLEEKKIAKPIKKIEKAISDKLFGKVKE